LDFCKFALQLISTHLDDPRALLRMNVSKKRRKKTKRSKMPRKNRLSRTPLKKSKNNSEIETDQQIP